MESIQSLYLDSLYIFTDQSFRHTLAYPGRPTSTEDYLALEYIILDIQRPLVHLVIRSLGESLTLKTVLLATGRRGAGADIA